MNIGDPVYWATKTRAGNTVERAGVIFGIVQPECSPNKLFPNMFSKKIQTRNYTSYIVNLYGSHVLFWPPHVEALPADKEYLKDTQTPITSKKPQIDRSDRHKLRKWIKNIGWEFSESSSAIHILTIKKRVWFRTLMGQEFISNIEDIKLC